MPVTKPHLQRWYAVGELLRISNVPTAWADIACGWLVGMQLSSIATFEPDKMAGLLGLLLTSSGLYFSGMAWNDFFDAAVDSVERPWRPIPSGRISRKSAAMLAVSLMLFGMFAAGVTSWLNSTSLPVAVGGLLAVVILVYDGWLKQKWVGPFLLGSCRFANVLLGATLTPNAFSPLLLYLAATNGIYVTGISCLARGEIGVVSRGWLFTASLFFVLSLVMSGAIGLPGFIALLGSERVAEHSEWWLTTWWGILAWWGFGLARALLTTRRPSETGRIPRIVGQLLARIILLDTLLAAAIVGPTGYIIALLVLPAWWLRRYFAPS